MTMENEEQDKNRTAFTTCTDAIISESTQLLLLESVPPHQPHQPKKKNIVNYATLSSCSTNSLRKDVKNEPNNETEKNMKCDDDDDNMSSLQVVAVQEGGGGTINIESFNENDNGVEWKVYHNVESNNIQQGNGVGNTEEFKPYDYDITNMLQQVKNQDYVEIISQKKSNLNEKPITYVLNDNKNDIIKEGGNKEITYISLVRSNKPLQLYLSSYIITQIGEWFTYVASIELVEQILGPEKSKSSRRYISYLVVSRLTPFLFVTPFGGVLADMRDRRTSMIALDSIGSIVPLLFFIGLYLQSIPVVFLVTALQSTIAALYEPCRSAIIPLLVDGDEEMQKATTLAGLVWSAMAAFGAAGGGFMVSIVGMRACFVFDSCSFVLSALILMLMQGKWDASNQSKENKSIFNLVFDMITGGAEYISSSTFWPIVFIKLTSAIIYGGSDVLNVSFSEKGHESDESKNSRLLAILFCCVGFGCYIGPVIADIWCSMKYMNTVLNSCIIAFAIQAVGLLGMSYFNPFYWTCIFTIIRSAGSSIQWINSSVLLQTYSKPDMLGRVLAVDYGLALTGESMSAMLVGIMQDRWGMSAMEVCLVVGYFAMIVFLLWLAYLLHGPKFLL